MQVDLQQILTALRKRWWLAALVMLSAGAAAYLYSDAQPRVYQAQVTLVAQPVPPDNGLIEAIKKTMPTYAQELGNKDFWRQVIDDNLIRNVDVNALAGQIKIQPRPDQNAIVMTVDNSSGEMAAMLADRISNAFIAKQMAATQDVSAGGNRVVWDITQQADVPTQPYQPRPRLYGLAAALLGLILGLVLVIALELVDTTVRTPLEVEKYLGMNTLGIIPRKS